MGPNTSACGEALLKRNLTINLFLFNLKLFAFIFYIFKEIFGFYAFLKKKITPSFGHLKTGYCLYYLHNTFFLEYLLPYSEISEPQNLGLIIIIWRYYFKV